MKNEAAILNKNERRDRGKVGGRETEEGRKKMGKEEQVKEGKWRREEKMEKEGWKRSRIGRKRKRREMKKGSNI